MTSRTVVLDGTADRPEGDVPAGASSARRVLAPALACVGAFLAFLDATVVNISFPAIAHQFRGTSLADLSWILNAYNVVIAAFLVPAGRFADRFGRRRVFLAGVAVFTAASALCGAAPGVGVLVAARVLQALGAALLLPTSLALLLPWFPPQKRQAATAIWGSVAAVAAGCGPSLGGLLTAEATWRWVFYLNVPLGILALLLGPRLLREASQPDAAAPDVAGSAALAVGVGALALGLVKGEDWGWAGRGTLASLAVAVLGLGLAWRLSGSHPAPTLDRSLLRRRSVAVASVSVLLFATAFFANTLGNVIWLVGGWHWTALHAGLAITPVPLMSAVVARPAGRLADRVGAAWVVVPGAAVYVTGVLLLRRLAVGTPAFWSHWIPGAILTGIGVGLCFPTLGGAGLVGVPGRQLALASAVGSAARQLGAVLGVSLLVVVQTAAGRDLVERARAGWTLAACAGAACALVSLLLPRPARA